MGVSEGPNVGARLTAAYPQLFTTNMARAARFYAEELGFGVRFSSAIRRSTRSFHAMRCV